MCESQNNVVYEFLHKYQICCNYSNSLKFGKWDFLHPLHTEFEVLIHAILIYLNVNIWSVNLDIFFLVTLFRDAFFICNLPYCS